MKVAKTIKDIAMNDEHEQECECACCAGKDINAWHQEQMEKHGWFAHYVLDEGNGVDFHTHGMDQTYKHLDFQIVLPINHKTVNSIFWRFADLLKSGKQFKAGDRVAEIIEGYDVLCVEVTSGERNLLRVILPDADGNLEEKDLEGIYAPQYDGVDE